MTKLQDNGYLKLILYDISREMILYQIPLPVQTWVGRIFEDSRGRCWMRTGKGLLFHDMGSGEFEMFQNNPQDSSSLSHNLVNDIFEDKKGNLWFCTQGGGLNRMNQPKSDATQAVFRHWAIQNSDILSNMITSILEDHHGYLWLSSDKGISRFDPENEVFENFGFKENLQNFYKHLSKYKSEDGTLYFGGKLGLNVFHPDSFDINKQIPPVAITDFRLFNQSVSLANSTGETVDQKSPLSKHISYTEKIELLHWQNDMTFEFAALNFYHPEKNQYQYQLVGYDENWYSTTASHRLASYTNLSPGDYTFRVKGSNDDGLMNEEGASVMITILPPWWAYTLYGIAVVAALVFARQQVVNRERLKSTVRLEHMELEKVQEMDQLKSRFFANISHEFRTPLTLLLGPIKEMLAKASDYSEKNRLNMMQRNAQQLLSLVNQLLDLSKLEAGKLKLEAVKSDVVGYVRTLGSVFKSMAEHKKIEYRFNFPEEKIGLYFDRDKLETIINNLLSNALKFTQEGGNVNLALKAVLEEDKEWVEIRVADTGPGISQDQIDKVFDRFYQADGSQTREQEGTGIGLALTKELVELHHGSIQVESEIGIGTTFVILLPVGKDHLKEEEIIQELPLIELEEEKESTIHPSELLVPVDGEPEEKVQLEEEIETASEQPLVLVVEDNSDVRSYIKETIGKEYSVLEAENGKKGLKKAQEAIPDLILSDVMMPKMDGIELCKRLKTDEKTSHIPVILLTARGSGDDKMEGLETGADDYIIKPFEAQELLVRIKNLIQQREKLLEKFRKEIILKPTEVAVTSTDELFLNKVMEVIEANIDN